MTIEVRRITAEELRPFLDVMTTAFLARPDIDRLAEDLPGLWDFERTWAAFDGDRMCGTFRSWATEMTVPGGARLPAAAVAAVTVLPTHRRRGVLRAMVAAEHEAIRARGEAVGLLYASEYPIYGRFGYGPAVREATWSLDVNATQFHAAAAGGIELVPVDEESRDTIKVVFDAWRLRQPGEIKRRDYRWDFDLGLRPSIWGPDWKGYLALHRDDAGAVDGYARYHADEKWERRQPRYPVAVDELHALTDRAYAALWSFVASIDWVASVSAERRSPTERLPWLLTNARAASASDVGEGMWVRLMDVPRALEARRYGRPANLVLEVVDAEAPGGRLRLHLDADGQDARCGPTDDAPDLTLDVSALGAAYLGGAPLRYAASASGVDEHRAGALAEADALFRTLDEPWCSTFF